VAAAAVVATAVAAAVVATAAAVAVATVVVAVAATVVAAAVATATVTERCSVDQSARESFSNDSRAFFLRPVILSKIHANTTGLSRFATSQWLWLGTSSEYAERQETHQEVQSNA
jgi:hypothetical protein